jgi:hypothetical protein
VRRREVAGDDAVAHADGLDAWMYPPWNKIIRYSNIQV